MTELKKTATTSSANKKSEDDHRVSPDTTFPLSQRSSLTDTNNGGFVAPEYEFDQFEMDLAGIQDDDLFLENDSGPMTPDGFIEEDFEAELGCCGAQEMTVQEALDVEYRDITRLGVIQVAGDDRLGRKVIVFSACRLPTYGKVNYQRLYEYIKKTLEQYVAMDYSLVYFHYGLTSQNKPPLRWLVQAYRGFDRNFKKNLKALYIVHPTAFILFIIKLFKPIISRKFGQKINLVNNLNELSTDMHLDQLPIPQRVRLHDADVVRLSSPMQSAPTPYTNFRASQTGQTILTSVSGNWASTAKSYGPHQVFGVSLEYIKNNNNGDPIPLVIKDAVAYIRAHCMDVEGIFRRSPNATLVKTVQSTYNQGKQIRFEAFNDPHLPAVLIKTFLRELSEPLLTYEFYDEILKLHDMSHQCKVENAMKLISLKLPEDNYTFLKFLISFVVEVSSHSSENRMTSVNLGIVFGPNLLWSQFASISSFAAVGQITSFVQLLITNYDEIFIK